MSWSPQGIRRLKVEVLGSHRLTLETLHIRLGGEREFIKNATSGCIRERLERELSELQAAVQRKQNEIADLPTRVAQAQVKIREIESAIEALHSQTKEAREQKKLEGEIARTKRRLEQLKRQKTENSGRHNSMSCHGDA